MASFIESAHRGTTPGGVYLNIDILPLSLVAASGHSAGAAATPS